MKMKSTVYWLCILALHVLSHNVVNAKFPSCTCSPWTAFGDCSNTITPGLVMCGQSQRTRTCTNCDISVATQEIKECQDNCFSQPCLNSGRCINEANGFTCVCAKGFTGDTCNEDIDECATSPCLNGGTCTDEMNKFTCTCKPGFSGITCGTNINDCDSSPCSNGGSCCDEINDFICVCAAGYTGKKCDEDINDCEQSPCLNGGQCTDGINQFTCSCEPGFTGKTCETNIDDCLSSPCLNGGICVDETNGFTCVCGRGFIGNTCKKGCKGVGDVVFLLDSSSSVGRPNFEKMKTFVVDIIDKLDIGSDTIRVGAMTFASDAIVRLQLDAVFDPDLLKTSIMNIPYFGGGTYTNLALQKLYNEMFTQRNGARMDVPNIAILITDGLSTDRAAAIREADIAKAMMIEIFTVGVGGKVNTKELADIASDPANPPDQHVFTALSFDALQGIVASLADATCGATTGTECASFPCSNGGTCSNAIDGFTCTCKPGFIGITCGTDENDCDSSPCSNGGTCCDEIDGFTCVCAAGYTGEKCDKDINECLSSPCLNGGTCNDGINQFTCSCKPGFSGTTCGININDCDSSPCSNGGTCCDEIDGFTCVCAAGYTGKQCDKDINECLSSPCLNGGTCNDGINQFTCSCKPGFTGITCGIDKNDCNSSPCVNGGKCIDEPNGFTCVCVKGFTGNRCDKGPCVCKWGPFGPCDATAKKLYGQMTRHRKCAGGCTPYDGLHNESTTCNNGGWSTWSPWGRCSEECGGGLRSRTRTCTNPKPNCGKFCIGDNKEVETCNRFQCSVVVKWTKWSPCSKPCGYGKQFRYKIHYSSSFCKFQKKKKRTCNKHLCSDPHGY